MGGRLQVPAFWPLLGSAVAVLYGTFCGHVFPSPLEEEGQLRGMVGHSMDIAQLFKTLPIFKVVVHFTLHLRAGGPAMPALPVFGVPYVCSSCLTRYIFPYESGTTSCAVGALNPGV